MIHATQKSMEDLGDKVEEQEKTDIEAAIADLEESLKGDDKEAITEKTTKLTEVAGKLAERAYAENSKQQKAVMQELTLKLRIVMIQQMMMLSMLSLKKLKTRKNNRIKSFSHSSIITINQPGDEYSSPG